MKFGAALLVTISMFGASASAAGAADSIYWANYDTDTISIANLDGSGSGRDLFTAVAPRGGTLAAPTGLALDPAAGTIYWGNWTGKLTRGSLDSCDAAATCATDIYPLITGGPPVDFPGGPALDVANGLMYWMNATGALVRASLDGSGAVNSTVNTTGATPAGLGGTGGIAIDPRTNRIYWTSDDFVSGTISWANLDGSGGGDLNTTGASVGRPWGLAIDTASNRVYWSVFNGADANKGSVSWASLDGTGGGDLYTSASPGCSMLDGSNGLAIDHAANKIYWANYTGGSLTSANLDGSGNCANLASTGATMSGPDEVALLKTPVATSAPAISRIPIAGNTLSCSSGNWSAGSPEANLYRSPRSLTYQWTRGAAVISGATAATFTPTSSGSYGCTVTATNNAGSTTGQASAFAFKRSVGFAKPKFKRKTSGSKLLLTGKITPLAKPAVSAKDCKGSVALKVVLKKKKIAGKSFALKYKSGKCSAAASLKVAKKYAGKKVTLTISVVGSKTLTAAPKSVKLKI
jgi:hypothetical protein